MGRPRRPTGVDTMAIGFFGTLRDGTLRNQVGAAVAAAPAAPDVPDGGPAPRGGGGAAGGGEGAGWGDRFGGLPAGGGLAEPVQSRILAARGVAPPVWSFEQVEQFAGCRAAVADGDDAVTDL